jgi:hypothetical protein
LVVGVLLGWLALWQFGAAMVLTDDMGGYGWPGYALSAWQAHTGAFTKIDALRTPLHPVMLGALGEQIGSYANAGIILSSLGCAVAVLAAGLGAAALSSGWAGGLAALACGLGLAMHGAPSAVNQYPMLAGFSGAALGFAAVAARYPGASVGLLCGAAMGLSVAGETRGILLAPLVVCLVMLGMRRGSGWRRWGLLLGFVVTLSLGLGVRAHQADLQYAARGAKGPNPSHQDAGLDERKLAQQRQVVQRWVRLDQDLSPICGRLEADAFMKPAFLSTECAEAVFEKNFRKNIPAYLPLGVGLTLLSLVFLVLPGRRRRGLDGALLVILGGGSIAAVAALTPMPARYVIPQATLLAIAGAAGIGRLASWLPGPLPGLSVLAVAAWMVSGGRTGHAVPGRKALSPGYARYVRVHDAVAPLLADDDVLLDCADLHFELSILPRRTRSTPLTRPLKPKQCQHWIAQPEPTAGTAWILVGPAKQKRHGAVPTDSDVSALVRADARWRESTSGDGWSLWHRIAE